MPARTRIGLSLTDGVMRAIAVRSERVLWTLAAALDADTPLDAEVAAFLRATPAASSWLTPHVVLAVAPSRAQLKCLPNLPEVPDRVLAGIVREGAGRFFRKNGVPLDTSNVRRSVNGAWTAAFERPLISSVASGCRIAGFALVAAVPSVAVVRHAVRMPVVRWSAEGTTFVLELDDSGALRSIHAVTGVEPSTAQAPAKVLAAALAPLAETAWEYAEAYGAAVSRDFVVDTALELRARRSDAPMVRRRLTIAIATCSLIWALAGVIPTMILLRQAAAARRDLVRLAPQRAAAATAVAELERANTQLMTLRAFDATRGRMTALLRGAAASIPAGSAIVALRVDSVAGTLVAVSPHAGAFVEALEHVPDIASPEIVGPITRELAATSPPFSAPGAPSAGQAQELERVTVRFRLTTPNKP